MNDTPASLLSEIESDIQAIEQNRGLFDETNFESRADIIDFIDFHIINRLEGLPHRRELDLLKQRAEKVKQGLGKIDAILFERLRRNIRKAGYNASSFTETIFKYVKPDISSQGKVGYDNLDTFINGLISDQPIPEATKELELEMVFYQKTPARIVFELAKLAKIKQGDIFFDIGSGLGQVPILMNLVTGAVVKGVEYEHAYYNYAKQSASQLNLADVEFINADARNADYSHGTIFFMYTPFEGYMLQKMLEILQKESRNRIITVFTYGPCSTEVIKHNWLNCINGNADDCYKLYEFVSLPG